MLISLIVKDLLAQTRCWLSFCTLLLLAVLFPHALWAQDIAQVKKGVVKITAQVEGKNQNRLRHHREIGRGPRLHCDGLACH